MEDASATWRGPQQLEGVSATFWRPEQFERGLINIEKAPAT